MTFRPQSYWPIYRQHPDLEIPETWDNLQAFVEWWMSNGRPMLVPHDAPTICTDDATAACIFRKGQFQVELYLLHPNKVVQTHAHPDMEVMIMSMGGGGYGNPNPVYGTSDRLGATSYIYSGEYHALEKNAGGGFVQLSFEHWLNGVPPTSAAIQWVGPTAGPEHDRLLGLA